MKHFRRPRIAPLPGFLALVIAWAGALTGPAAASLRSTCDIVERFGVDPLTVQDERGTFLWFANGSWEWRPQGTVLASKGSGMSSLLWVSGDHFTGSMSLRFRLVSKESRARLLFAFDPGTGAHRWVEVAAGSPGRVTLGQTGDIRGSVAGIIQVWRAPVAVGAWQSLGLVIAADKSTSVFLGGRQLFKAAAAPLAPGRVGFGSAGGAVVFDEFSYTAAPDGEPCRECHAGQSEQPTAADVYKYWDGRWWDTNRGGNAGVQEGGHGDPGGKPALGCTGSTGCHDMRQPTPAEHRNGFREGRNRQSMNAYHLQPGFIVEAPENSWDAQVVFDAFCTNQCHRAQKIGFDPVTGEPMNHERSVPDGVPPEPGVRFGKSMSCYFGEKLSIPVDSDITRRATLAAPSFAPCISCHDPHGTASAKVSDPTKGVRSSNRMLRADVTIASNALCGYCHMDFNDCPK